jgi:dethiobiotin synthetase
LLRAFAAQGKRTLGMKPVAAGCEDVNGVLVCDDVEQLIAASNVAAPREQVNPYAFLPPVAPHLAAAQAGVEISVARIAAACAHLRTLADMVIVEGVGGFRVPLNDREDSSDLAQRLGMPVIMVVGMRLGCINHALLTAQAIEATGLKLAGWIANGIDPAMAMFDANMRALEERLAAPLLGAVPHGAIAGGVHLDRLDGKAIF